MKIRSNVILWANSHSHIQMSLETTLIHNVKPIVWQLCWTIASKSSFKGLQAGIKNMCLNIVEKKGALTCCTSRPRAHTSVVMRTRVVPDRNSTMIASLSFWGMSPCIAETVKLLLRIFSVSQSTCCNAAFSLHVFCLYWPSGGLPH